MLSAVAPTCIEQHAVSGQGCLLLHMSRLQRIQSPEAADRRFPQETLCMWHAQGPSAALQQAAEELSRPTI